jgi:predicted methyltransferase
LRKVIPVRFSVEKYALAAMALALPGLISACGGAPEPGAEATQSEAVQPRPEGAHDRPTGVAMETAGAAHLEAAVSSPGRPEADRDRDVNRKPADVLAFCGIEPGMRIGELMVGTGYYTEILSVAVGPEGRVHAQNSPFVLERYYEKPWSERLARLPLKNVNRIDAEPESPGLPGGLDVVLLIRFYHDFYWMKVDRAAVNKAVFQALAPGGVFCVVDHHAEAGSRDRDVETLHRVDAGMVKEEILAAGFVFDDESDVLRNHGDDRSWNIFKEDGAYRDQTDRFIFRFRKPR